jgi:hypothetical protein
MKLYTVVVHNLQMCMKENPISGLGGVVLTRYTTPLFVKV